MATLDIGNVARNQPNSVHVGVNRAVCRISLSVSLSAGDIHRIGKLPHGAIPLDSIFYRGSAIAAKGVLKLGTSASQELFFASDTYSTVVNRQITPLGTVQQISLSDDVMPRYQHIVMVGSAGISIGHVGDLIVYYAMPGQTP
jgi:hypothetical protein